MKHIKTNEEYKYFNVAGKSYGYDELTDPDNKSNIDILPEKDPNEPFWSGKRKREYKENKYDKQREEIHKKSLPKNLSLEEFHRLRKKLMDAGFYSITIPIKYKDYYFFPTQSYAQFDDGIYIFDDEDYVIVQYYDNDDEGKMIEKPKKKKIYGLEKAIDWFINFKNKRQTKRDEYWKNLNDRKLKDIKNTPEDIYDDPMSMDTSTFDSFKHVKSHPILEGKKRPIQKRN